MENYSGLFSKEQLTDLNNICDDKEFLKNIETACTHLIKDARYKNASYAKDDEKKINAQIKAFHKALSNINPGTLFMFIGMPPEDATKYLENSSRYFDAQKTEYAYRHSDKFVRDRLLTHIERIFIPAMDTDAMAGMPITALPLKPSTNPTGDAVNVVEIILEAAKINAPEKRIPFNAEKLIRDLIESGRLITATEIHKESKIHSKK